MKFLSWFALNLFRNASTLGDGHAIVVAYSTVEKFELLKVIFMKDLTNELLYWENNAYMYWVKEQQAVGCWGCPCSSSLFKQPAAVRAVEVVKV